MLPDLRTVLVSPSLSMVTVALDHHRDPQLQPRQRGRVSQDGSHGRAGVGRHQRYSAITLWLLGWHFLGVNSAQGPCSAVVRYP